MDFLLPKSKRSQMKLYELKGVVEYLQSKKRIKRARRVKNNIIEIDFGDESIFFDLTRGNSTIYKAPSKRPPQEMSAPFDTLLHQLISQSQIVEIKLLRDDKIIQIITKPKSQYKEKIVTLQLEFTGRYTNAILLDEEGVVIEALHHIDSSKSYRVVKPNVKLLPLKPFEAKREEEILKDVNSWLEQNYQKALKRELKSIKAQRLQLIKKRLSKVQNALNSLEDSRELQQRAKTFREYGNLILANLHNIKDYDKTLKTCDFEGKEIEIPLPEGIAKNRFSQYYFDLAKKLESKAKNIYIERDNLQGKIAFYENIIHSIQNSNDPYEIELLVPKQGRAKKRKERLKYGELYWIEGYKVFVGRNSKENQKLLELAKANDIWMHIRDIPSSHLIIRTDKQNLPDSLLYQAAKLCVDLSIKQSGDYEVDYTKRKFVKIKDGSNVEYDKYKTIRVVKEGVEIRV
jgi:predicted ribosome quality control (RQC) complex YloA/Tae2 family protein